MLRDNYWVFVVGERMKFFDHNPRQITEKQFTRLVQDMADYGDLGGIVHDINSDQVISGNQRCRVIDLSKAQPVILEKLDSPTKQGTIAYGFIEWLGERFSYRQVDWTPEQCLEANIKANLDGGTWDFNELANWDLPPEMLQGCGFDDDFIKGLHNEAFELETLLGVDGNIEDVKFKEYDEDVADEVEMITCPHCGKEFPK